MGADHFRDSRIKTANQFTSGIVIMAERSRNQEAFISRVHVAEVASTLLTKTSPRTLRLQNSVIAQAWHIDPEEKNVTAVTSGRSSAMKEAQMALPKQQNRQEQTMKQNLLALTAAAAIALGGFGVALAKTGPAGHRVGLEHLTKSLNLTPDQQAKVQPILDQARPQIAAIHQDAAQKTKAVITNTVEQIRPLLTPEQQKKLDAQQKAHEDLRTARKELHEATQD
jgi:hypothetical protein